MSTSRPPEFTHDTENTAFENRPRKSTGVVVLLVVLTLANVGALVLTITTLADAADHGMDEVVAPLTVSLLLTVVALVALGGAWATRKWGPWLYLGAVVADRLMALVAFPDFFPPVAILGVVLAAGLVSASRKW